MYNKILMLWDVSKNSGNKKQQKHENKSIYSCLYLRKNKIELYFYCKKTFIGQDTYVFKT